MQPPHTPKCLQRGSTLSSLGFLMLTALASMKLCFLRMTCRSQTSPGTTHGTNTTMSLTLAMDLPSAAKPVISMFSSMGRGFLFLLTEVDSY